jgi:hypothetical protein
MVIINLEWIFFLIFIIKSIEKYNEYEKYYFTICSYANAVFLWI